MWLAATYNAATGAQQWAKCYTGPGNGDEATPVAVSASEGTVFVTGYSTRTLSAQAYLTVAYSG